jgi:hypothetical protein
MFGGYGNLCKLDKVIEVGIVAVVCSHLTTLSLLVGLFNTQELRHDPYTQSMQERYF